MSRKIIFVAFVLDSSDEASLVETILSPSRPGLEVFNLGQSEYVSPAEMFSRFGAVRKISARSFKPGQASFDFVPPSAAR